jgi:hypothetical protein
MAVDVARFGDDESVIGVRKGNSLTRYDVLNNVDVYMLAKAVKRVADEERPEYIKVDAVGIGAGVADILRAWGYKALDYVAQERAFSADKFVNKRTESWYNLREKFRLNEINIPPDEIMVGQLSALKYKFDSAGRYMLESKDDVKKRGLTSPDRADVVAMLFESDDDFSTHVAGEYDTTSPKKDTVEYLLKQLSVGKEEELQWHTMKL